MVDFRIASIVSGMDNASPGRIVTKFEKDLDVMDDLV